MMDDSGSKQAQAHPTTMLFVSLYMVVLSFFILLFSISEREEDKARKVTESVQHSFQQILPVSLPLGQGQAGEELERQELFDAIREGIATHIPLQRVQFQEAGDFLHIHLPVTELFTPGSAAVRQDREELFASLATLTTRYNKRHQLHFTFYHPAKEEESALIYQRLGHIARYCENHGIPTAAITVGIHEGQETLLIAFRFIAREEKP